MNDYRVILTLPTWILSGVTTYSVLLARSLAQLGIECEILITKSDVAERDPLPLSADVPIRFLPLPPMPVASARWGALIRYLESRAPCVYVPNYDFFHSAICPRLRRDVIVAGIVHGDDPDHYEHARRLGRYWDIIVAVSGAIAEEIRSILPEEASRLKTIPSGVTVPPNLPPRLRNSGDPVKVLYSGRLCQHPKRVLDLPRIARALHKRGIPSRLTIFGAGPDAEALRFSFSQLETIQDVTFHPPVDLDRMADVYREHDVLLLVSEFEGLPLVLLEAMAHGMVPVVSDIRSGIPELIRHGINGFRVPVGDVEGFADKLALLATSETMRLRMSLEAHRTMLEGPYQVTHMATKYAAAFTEALDRVRKGLFRRPRGRILPPPNLPLSWKDRLPEPLWRFARRLKRLATRSTREDSLGV